jgi:hypothetical protein
LTGGGDIEDPLLNGTGEVKEVGILHEENGIESVLPHQGLEFFVPGFEFAGGGQAHFCSSERDEIVR